MSAMQTSGLVGGSGRCARRHSPPSSRHQTEIRRCIVADKSGTPSFSSLLCCETMTMTAVFGTVHKLILKAAVDFLLAAELGVDQPSLEPRPGEITLPEGRHTPARRPDWQATRSQLVRPRRTVRSGRRRQPGTNEPLCDGLRSKTSRGGRPRQLRQHELGARNLSLGGTHPSRPV